MSQQSDSWAVKGGSGRVKCPKHDIYINNCSYNLDCERCINETYIPKKQPKKAKKQVQK